jgi:hypothetical protein
MSVTASLVSLSNGAQRMQRTLQAFLALFRGGQLARLTNSQSRRFDLHYGVHGGWMARRSLSLIGQHTLQTTQ